jgi:hypothetical protein
MPRIPIYIGLPCCIGLMIFFAVVGATFGAAFWGFLSGAYLMAWALD